MVRSVSQWLVMGVLACSCQPEKNGTHCQAGVPALEEAFSSQEQTDKVESMPVTYVDLRASEGMGEKGETELPVISSVASLNKEDEMKEEEIAVNESSLESIDNEMALLDLFDAVSVEEEGQEKASPAE